MRLFLFLLFLPLFAQQFPPPSGGGGGGVSSVSVATANGTAGSVATPTTTPVITLTFPFVGLAKSDGTAISAAVAGTDYYAPLASLSLGTGNLSAQFTVGTGGVAANTIVKTDSAGRAIAVLTSDTGSGIGIALSTVAANGVVQVALFGTTVQCIADNNTTQGNLIGVGTTTATFCKDLGVTSGSSLDIGIRIIGTALTTVTANGSNTVQVRLSAHSGFGRQISSGDIVSVSAASLPNFGVHTGDCVGTFPTITCGTAIARTGTDINTSNQVTSIHDKLTALVFGSSPYTVVTADSLLTCDASGGAVVINLPAATGTGRELSLKKIDSSTNACTLTRAGSDLIDGATTAALTSQYAAAKIIDTASAVWSRSHVNQLAGDVIGASTANVVGRINGTSLAGLGTGILKNTTGTGVPSIAGASDMPAVALPTPGSTCSMTGNSTFCICTTTCTITPLTPVAGSQLCVRNDMNVSTVITLAAISSVFYEKADNTAYGTVNSTMVSGGAVGDKVCLVGRDATHYLTFSSAGTWTTN